MPSATSYLGAETVVLSIMAGTHARLSGTGFAS